MIVSVRGCNKYDLAEIKFAMKKSIDDIGGIGAFVKNNDKVLLKLNLLGKRDPDDAATTHPVFVEALTEIVMEAGGVVTICDSPGGLYNEKILKDLYRVTGMSGVAERTGAKLNFDTSFVDVNKNIMGEGRKFTIIKPILDADVIINLPKLKTHCLTYFTGAVKNIFGTIPGAYKAGYHFSHADKDKFCDMLIDLCEFVSPHLHVMDGIIGMEGNGPGSGTPRQVGVILSSASPYSLDLVAARIIDMDYKDIPYLKNAETRGIFDTKEVEICGENPEEYVIRDFKKPETKSKMEFLHFLPLFMRKIIRNLISTKPNVMKNKCIGCRECHNHCPAKVIKMVDKKAKINYNGCIRCWCCQELCPAKAISVKKSFLLRIIDKLK